MFFDEVFFMLKKVHPKRKAEERKIKTESGKRLYILLQEDISRSGRVKKILGRAAASLFIVFMIILLVIYLV